MKSKCCDAEIEIAHNDEGSNWYECSRCGKPCDSAGVSMVGFFEAREKGRGGSVMKTAEELANEYANSIEGKCKDASPLAHKLYDAFLAGHAAGRKLIKVKLKDKSTLPPIGERFIVCDFSEDEKRYYCYDRIFLHENERNNFILCDYGGRFNYWFPLPKIEEDE